MSLITDLAKLAEATKEILQAADSVTQCATFVRNKQADVSAYNRTEAELIAQLLEAESRLTIAVAKLKQP